MTYANPIQRRELIAGLHALASFLQDNPKVPAPAYADVLVFPPFASDSENHREIDIIAARIGCGTETTPNYHHYQTRRQFGPVEYRAIAIPADESREQ